MWEGGAAVGGTFRVVWLRRYDLPFGATEHLTNPLNEGKPVKIGRDGQELPPDVGEALVALIEEGADAAGVPRPTRPAGEAVVQFCCHCSTAGSSTCLPAGEESVFACPWSPRARMQHCSSRWTSILKLTEHERQ